ncbi:LicD family protein [Stackebrandtia nassauensis]|uniref:LicD family protein n=1 Tax=Stackebrandtia nassauensis (strain DSM 44728 / CIP 108903 / NRRL B-16338 / NBRC 102104 / LLR-40K-21) TaxID=446470 RepID=D3Q8Z2_STANL|nr:LicD family protein [Stackebrandtia nassauensis]ADD40601.1 LicD family protein [Stackebrandtia nassauensis DSM 44728]
MAFSTKQTVVRVLSRAPVYRAMPSGAARTYAALKYLGQNSNQEEITRFIRASGGIPTRYLSVALVAARAVFRAGADELLTDTLAALDGRFPESPGLQALHADFHAYYGRYEEALECARNGRMLQPSHAGCVARMITYGYRVLPRDEADAAAVVALKRFPRTGEVLWAVAKMCDSAAQYGRLQEAWDSLPHEDPTDLHKALRQLATAAARAGEVERACELYSRGIQLIVDGIAVDNPIVDSSLEGKSPWAAFEDLHRALDGAGVPYFIAAGTALGLERQGRPLSADNDIDVGVFEEDFDQDALIKLFAKNPRFDFDVVHPHTKKVGLKHRGGSPIDIFRFYRDGDKMWHDAVFVRWGNSPFEIKRREFEGLNLPLPATIDNYLTENYGDWRTPYPGFDAFDSKDAPNVETTWPEYLKLHYIRRGYKKLTNGDRTGAAADLRSAGEEALARTVTAS